MMLFPLLASLLTQPVFAQNTPEQPAVHASSTQTTVPQHLIEPINLLQKMQQAFHHDNYELSYIHVRQGMIEPIRLFHGVVDHQEVVHRLYLNGPVREAVRRGHQVVYYEMGKAPLSINASQLPGMMETLANISIEQLTANYDLLASGKGRVAGRSVQILRIIPKHDSLYGLYVWLGSQSGLPLRIDTVDRHGNLVEQLMAIGLVQFDTPTDWMKKLASIDLPAIETPPTPPRASLNWKLSWKPEGMKIISDNQHRLAITQQDVNYIKLSDGLFTVSVYASAAPDSRILQGDLVRQGATSMHSVVHNGMEITVVGEVPPQTAALIAQSVKLVANPSQSNTQESLRD
ncbi:MucB/RseB C-terminal domain-containing protein [Celerinatantimonas yamalensis]|uniref:MucB/RseB C-terminal domain-containing protein n=1 Tax=Celerinatantimonas yamalensis TaxID=559956 RepID=A0ABW9G7T1_9GAMM